jgi:hypothetical protein
MQVLSALLPNLALEIFYSLYCNGRIFAVQANYENYAHCLITPQEQQRNPQHYISSDLKLLGVTIACQSF